MRLSTFWTVAALAVSLAIASPAAAQKQKNGAAKASGQNIAVDQLPAAVKQSMHTIFPNGTIESASKMTLGKEIRYELSIKPDGSASPTLIMSTADGSLRTITGTPITSAADLAKASKKGKGKKGKKGPDREEISASQLPDPITQAIHKSYPKGTIQKAFKVTNGKQTGYELQIQNGGKTINVVLNPDGTTFKKKKK
jgi:hypothetical protein